LLGWPGPVTNRQFEAWQCWRGLQWDRPDRTDQYLMQIACEVVRSRVKDPAKVKLSHFKLDFGRSGRERPVTREQATRWSQAAWFSSMTMPVKVQDGRA